MPGGFLQASIPAEALTTHKVGSHEAPQAGHQSEAHGGYPGLRHSDCNCCSGKICKRTQGGVRAVLRKTLGANPSAPLGSCPPGSTSPLIPVGVEGEQSRHPHSCPCPEVSLGLHPPPSYSYSKHLFSHLILDLGSPGATSTPCLSVRKALSSASPQAKCHLGMLGDLCLVSKTITHSFPW